MAAPVPIIPPPPTPRPTVARVAAIPPSTVVLPVPIRGGGGPPTALHHLLLIRRRPGVVPAAQSLGGHAVFKSNRRIARDALRYTPQRPWIRRVAHLRPRNLDVQRSVADQTAVLARHRARRHVGRIVLHEAEAAMLRYGLRQGTVVRKPVAQLLELRREKVGRGRWCSVRG